MQVQLSDQVHDRLSESKVLLIEMPKGPEWRCWLTFYQQWAWEKESFLKILSFESAQVAYADIVMQSRFN